MKPAHLCLMTLLVLGLVLLAPEASGQERYLYSVSLLGGIGGSLDDSDVGFGEGTLQFGFAYTVEQHTLVAIRVGTLGFDDDAKAGPYRDADVRYANIGGEYRFNEGYYQSGIYFGLGVYDLSAASSVDDQTKLGLVLGVTGDFEINPRWAVYVEFAGHYADFEKSQFLGTLHAGVAFNF